MMKALAVCIAGAIVMACSHENGGSKGGTGRTPAPPAQAPATTGTLVTFTREGGIAAFNDTLVVGEDGSLSLTDKNGKVKKGSAPAADVARLKGLLNSAAFKALPALSTSKGADQMTYTVRVPGVGTVSTMDGVSNPPVLDQVLHEMQALMDRVR
jgi:hypothetical protein